MCKFEPNILFYKGKYKKGIIVNISIKFEDIYYDSLYYYDKNYMLLTVPDELEIKLGYSIKEDNDYLELINILSNIVDPYDQIIESLPILEEI
jgi:hypothetical protein